MIRMTLTLFFVLFLIEASNAKVKKQNFLPKAFQAEFDQVTKSLLSKKEKRSKITFKYAYKGNFFMEAAETKSVYICNPKEFWYYQPPAAHAPSEKGTVSVGSTSRHCYSQFFDSLRGGLENNSKYKVEKISKTEYLLKFEPKEITRLNIKKLKLFFESERKEFKNLARLDIYWVDDDKPLKLERKTITLKDSFPKNTFRFKIPKNTAVQKLD